MIVTIDGPSGTGKSTVAARVAQRLGFVYFDTGAMYRAFTWVLLEKNIDVQDSCQVAKVLEEFEFNIEESQGEKRYFVGNSDVTEVIRSRLVTSHVSAVSALAEVRTWLLRIQHQFGLKRDAVFEGRDLGTVVFPQAQVKIFLIADPKVRAERRLNELQSKKSNGFADLNCEETMKELLSRDAYDSSRLLAPLKCPEGAFVIDTTSLSIEEVVDKVVEVCHPYTGKA